MRSGSAQCVRKAQHGFTYVGLLLLIALVGAGLGVAASTWTLQQHREIEREQIWRGRAIAQALSQYHAGPSGKSGAPPVAAPAPGHKTALTTALFTASTAERAPQTPPFANASAASGAAQGDWPKRFDDLLEDRRSGRPVRHLRRLYADPCTGKTDWLLERNDLGGIVAVRSRCDRPAVLRDGFDAAPNGRTRLSDRRFGGGAATAGAPSGEVPVPP